MVEVEARHKVLAEARELVVATVDLLQLSVDGRAHRGHLLCARGHHAVLYIARLT